MGRAKGDDRGSKKRWRSTSEIIGEFLVVVVAHALFLGSSRMSGGFGHGQPVVANTARVCRVVCIREQLSDLKESAKLLIEDELQDSVTSRAVGS
jgi:hypothetical protein